MSGSITRRSRDYMQALVRSKTIFTSSISAHRARPHSMAGPFPSTNLTRWSTATLLGLALSSLTSSRLMKFSNSGFRFSLPSMWPKVKRSTGLRPRSKRPRVWSCRSASLRHQLRPLIRLRYFGISARAKRLVARRLCIHKLLHGPARFDSIGYQRGTWFVPGRSLFSFGRCSSWELSRASPLSPIRALLLRSRFQLPIQPAASL